MNIIQKIALTFTIIGAINWGLVGLFNLDLVALLFGTLSMISRIIYSIIGVAGVYSLALFWKLKKE